MLAYIIRKAFYSLLVLLGVLTITFFINYVLPGDPARLLLGQRADITSVEAIRKQLGLDRPLHEQYFRYISRALQGDFGRSFASNRKVTEIILERVPATALLAITAMTVATILGILLGIVSALRANTWLDSTLMTTALLGISLPSFVTGLLFALLFGVILQWLPISGYITKGWHYLLLPMITLGIRPLSIIARLTRSSMLEVLNQEYIRTARAKGLPQRQILFKHALRNALNPVVTAVSAWFAALLAGTFFIEYIFNWPGIGTVAINAIEKLDYPVIQGVVLFTAIIFVIINLLIDIVYAFLDPKIKLS